MGGWRPVGMYCHLQLSGSLLYCKGWDKRERKGIRCKTIWTNKEKGRTRKQSETLVSSQKETTGRILGMQDPVSDTRWSMMCTDCTSSALMMDARRVRQKCLHSTWEQVKFASDHIRKIQIGMLVWQLHETDCSLYFKPIPSANKSKIKYFKMLFDPGLLGRIWG